MGVAAKVSKALTPQKIAHWIDFFGQLSSQIQIIEFFRPGPLNRKNCILTLKSRKLISYINKLIL